MNYICDFCNTVVDEGTLSCPKCGLVFSNTRCPICSFVGQTKLFKNGCPECLKVIGEDNRQSIQKTKSKHSSNVSNNKIKMSPLLKFILLIVGINIALIWYITYVEIFK